MSDLIESAVVHTEPVCAIFYTSTTGDDHGLEDGSMTRSCISCMHFSSSSLLAQGSLLGGCRTGFEEPVSM